MECTDTVEKVSLKQNLAHEVTPDLQDAPHEDINSNISNYEELVKEVFGSSSSDDDDDDNDDPLTRIEKSGILPEFIPVDDDLDNDTELDE